MSLPASPPARRRIAWGAAVLGILVVGGALAWAAFGTPAAPEAAPVPTATAAPTATPTPTPTPTGHPVNTEVYDLAGLPVVDVFAVVPALPVDDDPMGALPGITARAAADLVPLFADPAGDPVGALPRESFFDGTTVAVVEREEHWAKVLLVGRAASPSNGQLSGWVRAQDVEFAEVGASVEVDLAAGTVEIVSADGTRERIADDFAWGTAETPTPTGRSFIMLVRSEPSLEYTQGHPIVYLSEQSRTLAGFDGADVAVTAFHYHDERSGPISNGCIRLDAAAIDRLAQLPEGTPVHIR